MSRVEQGMTGVHVGQFHSEANMRTGINYCVCCVRIHHLSP